MTERELIDCKKEIEALDEGSHPLFVCIFFGNISIYTADDTTAHIGKYIIDVPLSLQYNRNVYIWD